MAAKEKYASTRRILVQYLCDTLSTFTQGWSRKAEGLRTINYTKVNRGKWTLGRISWVGIRELIVIPAFNLVFGGSAAVLEGGR